MKICRHYIRYTTKRGTKVCKEIAFGDILSAYRRAVTAGYHAIDILNTMPEEVTPDRVETVSGVLCSVYKGSYQFKVPEIMTGECELVTVYGRDAAMRVIRGRYSPEVNSLRNAEKE